MSCSPYVVGKTGNTPFQDIQSAINTARDEGGGTVYIQPGKYEENLNLYENVDLYGAGALADTQECSIIGTHTPPICGNIAIRNLCLWSKRSIFSSTEAGESSIFLNCCFIGVKEGYIFELPNWTEKGKFVVFDLGDAGSINNGFVLNYGGANVLVIAATFGSGKNSMHLSGKSAFFTIQCRCPIILHNNSEAIFYSGCCFERQIRTNDKAGCQIFNSSFMTKSEPILFHNSSGSVHISEAVVACKAKYSIEGTGIGLVTIGSLTSTYAFNISDSIKTSYGNFFTGELFLKEPKKGLNLYEGTNGTMGLAKLKNGEASILTKAIKDESRVFLTIQKASKDFGSIALKKKHPGKGFDIISSNKKDDSEIAWLLVQGC